MWKTACLMALVLGCGSRVDVSRADGALSGSESEDDGGEGYGDTVTSPSCGESVRTATPSGACGASGLKCHYEVRNLCPDGKTVQTFNEYDCTCDGTWRCEGVGGGLSLTVCPDAG